MATQGSCSAPGRSPWAWASRPARGRHRRGRAKPPTPLSRCGQPAPRRPCSSSTPEAHQRRARPPRRSPSRPSSPAAPAPVRPPARSPSRAATCVAIDHDTLRHRLRRRLTSGTALPDLQRHPQLEGHRRSCGRLGASPCPASPSYYSSGADTLSAYVGSTSADSGSFSGQHLDTSVPRPPTRTPTTPTSACRGRGYRVRQVRCHRWHRERWERDDEAYPTDCTIPCGAWRPRPSSPDPPPAAPRRRARRPGRRRQRRPLRRQGRWSPPTDSTSPPAQPVTFTAKVRRSVTACPVVRSSSRSPGPTPSTVSCDAGSPVALAAGAATCSVSAGLLAASGPVHGGGDLHRHRRLDLQAEHGHQDPEVVTRGHDHHGDAVARTRRSPARPLSFTAAVAPVAPARAPRRAR